MERRSIEAIVTALNASHVRYLIAGGFAVVAHGYARFTADLDLIVDLEEQNVRQAIAALAALGYRPRAPVPFEQFADAARREEWIRDKGLTVFSLFSSEHAATEVDLFAAAPLDFQQAFLAAAHVDLSPGVRATILGLDDLLLLKRRAGRPKDLEDVNQLTAIHKKKVRPDGETADGRYWEHGWEGHAQAQAARLAQLPMGQKLAWLEEAQHLVGDVCGQATMGPSPSSSHAPRGNG